MTADERKQIEERGPSRFPDDFGRRLEQLKELAGVSWRELAERLGVTERGMLKWRKGGPPSGAYFWNIVVLASEFPGGIELMLGGDSDTEPEELPGPPWPEDFPARLGRLEDLSGVSLEDFARAFGLPEDRAGEWRSGAKPTIDELWAMALWASNLSGGSEVLLAPYPLTRQGWE